MTAYHRGLSPLLLCAALTAVPVAQGTPDNPELKILSPGADAYVSGPTLLRAKVDPPDGVTALTFFVNGRQACALSKLPFECEWDAGPAIAEHQVRAVATLKGGARLVQTVRTKSVGYTERVDVDVVQVTVTVSDDHGRFLRDVAPEHQVTLLGFNDNIFTLTRKTTDRSERVKAVDRLAPWGSTALY